MEQWKTIVDDDGIVYEDYEVSTKGRIRSLKRGKLMKPQDNGTGYLSVGIRKDKKRYFFLVHRLVGIAFIPNPDNKPTINHINEDTHDNRVENLEWATQEEQNGHGTRTERQKQTMTEKCGKRVRCIDTGQIYDSVTQASKETGLPLYAISKVCTGKRKSYKGTHWEFVE